ncbi:hypothetical protein G6L26_007615 [Agrobacterium radiobacter]|uniref:hypothetical protein n=1 Tax=Agrobacterium tumefaciens complex TaxID=1183400 RepID=UPI000B2D593F|nr:hypothetical protein [Agrobacterium tumefaciens]NTA05038.1 hypothetical protein [Agrobacterium tumefaciens]NTA91633.1 hypothetical protein [Agrobacterium tumefaciens]NTB12783.1 hypothetical protein [Agrobacterium tumefaciens]SPZ35533.1 Uncharacterised protein [Agrobacterium tumefaciens]
MITAISVALYAVSLCFAAMFGTMAEMDKRGQVSKFHGRFVASLTAIFFVMAVALQVAS